MGGDRQTDRQRQTEADRQRDSDRDSEGDRDRQTDTRTDKTSHVARQTDCQTKPTIDSEREETIQHLTHNCEDPRSDTASTPCVLTGATKKATYPVSYTHLRAHETG